MGSPVFREPFDKTTNGADKNRQPAQQFFRGAHTLANQLFLLFFLVQNLVIETTAITFALSRQNPADHQT
jgi:hypothetical protein